MFGEDGVPSDLFEGDSIVSFNAEHAAEKIIHFWGAVLSFLLLGIFHGS